MMHLIDSAKGAIKLALLHLSHPTTVDSKQVIDIANEALHHLDIFDRSALALTETHRAVSAVCGAYRVAVAPSGQQDYPIKVYLINGETVVHFFKGRTPQGLAELVRLKLKEAA